MSHSQPGNWSYSLKYYLCPANKDLEQLFKRKNRKCTCKLKRMQLACFLYGTSSLSSLPGFRELCWASSVCSKHCLAFCFNSPPFRRCTVNDLDCCCQDEERLLRWVFWPWGFLPGTGSLLSLLKDAFCCVLDFSGGLNISQLPPFCAKILLDFWGVFHSPSCCRIVFCAVPCTCTRCLHW